MTTGPADFKIVDEDIQRLHRDLKAISAAFTEDTRTAGDVGPAFGHARLAKEFSSFSESWRVNRERMQKNIEELATQMGNIKIATDQVDDGLANGGGSAQAPSQAPTQQSSSAPGAGGNLPSSSGGGGGSGGGSGGSGGASLPATSATGGGDATPSDSTPGDGQADPVPDTDGTDADDTVVRVGDDGDFYASVTVGGATAAGATATLMALYKLWDAHRAKVSGDATPTSEADQADARSRLLAELEELGANGNDVTVELVSDGQSPDQVTAILRGEDGSISVIDVSPDADAGDASGADAGDGSTGEPTDGTGESTGSTGEGSTGADGGEPTSGTTPDDPTSGEAGGGEAGEGGTASSEPLPEVAPSDGGGGGGGGTAGGGTAAGSDPLAPVSPDDGAGTSGASSSHSFSGGGVTLGDVASTSPVEVVGEGDSGQGLRSPHVAGATAGMGMAGMGAVSAAGMGGGQAAGSGQRGQGEALRKVKESTDDEPAREEQR